MKDLSKQITKRIKKEHIKMRPKFWFDLEKLLLITGIILSVIFSVIFINLIIYIIKNNGATEFLEFGYPGWQAFWEGFPHGFFIWTIIFIALAYLFFSQFDFSYKKPSYQFIIIILTAGIGGGLLLSCTHANEALEDSVKKANIPVIAQAYKLAAIPGSGNHGFLARVENVGEGFVVAKLPNGKTVIITTNNNVSKNYNNVVVEGTRRDLEFEQAMSSISEAQKRFGQIMASQQAMIARFNELQEQQMQKIRQMQFQKGQVLKIIGHTESGSFQADDLAAVKSNFTNLTATKEN